MRFSGSKLRQLREAGGKSREEVAVALGTSSATIGNWEREVHVPDTNQGLALASYFGVTVEDLSEPADAA